MDYFKMNIINLLFELLILLFMIVLIVIAEVNRDIMLYFIALTVPLLTALIGSYILNILLDKHSKKIYRISYEFNNIKKDLLNLGFKNLSSTIYEKRKYNTVNRVILVDKKNNKDIIKELAEEIKTAKKNQKYYRNIIIYLNQEDYNDEKELNSNIIIVPVRHTAGWSSNVYGSYIIKCAVYDNHIRFCSYKDNPIFLEKIKELFLQNVK